LDVADATDSMLSKVTAAPDKSARGQPWLKMKVEVWKEEEHKQSARKVYTAPGPCAEVHGPPVGEASTSTLRKYQGGSCHKFCIPQDQGQKDKMAELPNGMAVPTNNDIEMKEEVAEVRVFGRAVRMRR
jgi:hypothetical protein